MPADFTVAKQIFDFYVNGNHRFACTWVDKGQQWYACPIAVMCRNVRLPDSQVVSYEGRPVSEKLKTKKESVYPENFLAPDFYPLEDKFTEAFCLGKQVISLTSGALVKFNRGRNMPMRHYSLLCPTLIENWGSFGNHRMYFEKSQGIPLLAVDFVGGTLYVTYYQTAKIEDIKIETADSILTPTCWSDTKYCYTKLRKESKMLEPDKFVNDILKANLKFDPEKPGKENDGTAGVTLTEAIKAQKPAKVTAEKPAEQKPAETTPTEVPVKEENKEEPVKRTRRKAETTPVNDLTKVIEQLVGAVPEMTPEDRIKAIRQLRDLQLAAARRIANISLQYIENTQDVEAKLAAIKAAL